MFISFWTIQLVSILLLSGGFDYNIVFFWGGVCAVLVGSASNVINDIFDIEIDKINRPERILPSQQITISNAWRFYFLLIFFSIILGYGFLPETPFTIVVLSNILLFIYSWKLKKTPIFGNLIVSFFIGLVFIYSTMLVCNFKSGITPFIFAFFLILSREIIKDIEDIEGDRQQFAKTTPIVFGIKKAKWITILSLVICFISLILSYLLNIYGATFFLIVSVFVIVPGLVLCFKIYNGNQKQDFTKISKLLKILILPSLAALVLDKIIK